MNIIFTDMTEKKYDTIKKFLKDEFDRSRKGTIEKDTPLGKLAMRPV